MSNAPLPDAPAPADASGEPIFGPAHLTRALIFILAGVFALVFRYAGEWLPWPRETGYGGSLAQPMQLGAFVVVLVLLIVCTLLGTFLLSRRWRMAGLLTATAGLAMWSVRGGSVQQVLFNADNSGAGPRVFLQMIGELIVLFGIIGGLWNMIWISGGAKQAEKLRDTADGSADKATAFSAMVARALGGSADDKPSPAIAVAAQAVMMAVILMILSVTPLKRQALTSVFVAGVAATALAEMLGDRSASRWYWIGPLAVGIFGYLAAYFNPAGIEIGDLQGTFAPLARLLPLDYASLGCAGVLFGVWWMEPEPGNEESGEKESTEPAA